MDRIDISIIHALQQNGRVSNQDLADAVGLSPSPCLRRVRNLEAAGVITGYAARVDQAAYGLPLTVFVSIKLQVHAVDVVRAFEERVRALEEVMECHVVSGTDDYLLRVVVADLDAFNRFIRARIQTLPGVGSIESNFSFSEVKRTDVLPRPPLDKRIASGKE